MHGLRVSVGADTIDIAVFNNGKFIYRLQIDNEGVENLVIPNDKFADLNAKRFLKNSDWI